MIKRIICVLVGLVYTISVFSQRRQTEIQANAPSITYTGRILIGDTGEVTYDWPGTYFRFLLNGDACWMRASDIGESHFNVFVDDQLKQKIVISGKDTLINLVKGLDKRKTHHIRVQKRSEGEFGRTTIHSFLINKGAVIQPLRSRPNRFIEFIGDSFTVGYGTDGLHRDEPFLVATENADKTYACILARYFEADYALIAHSGRGAVRNYGDSLTSSRYTMKDAMMNTLNSDTTIHYSFDRYRPDLVIINLGSNDFSTQPNPSQEEFEGAYTAIIQKIRKTYGKNTKILCVISRLGGSVEKYINQVIENLQDPNVYATASLRGVTNNDSDMGAAWHPGYTGHQKMAMFMIPYISTIMGWPLENKTVK